MTSAVARGEREPMFDPTALPPIVDRRGPDSPRRRIVVIGAGPGGIIAARALGLAGFDDVVVLEKADGPGLLDTSAGLSVFGDKALADAFGGDASGGLVARVEREEGRPAAEMVDLDLTVVTGGTSRTWTASFAEPSVQNLRVADSRSKVFDLLGRIVLTLLALLTVTVIALRIRVRR